MEGSLNIFNHHTNVDEDNRLVVYCIQDLGTQLAPIAMLVMMEAIQSRIIENGRRGRATWLYIDECHVLLNSDYSATYLQQLWKKVRKQGGLCTGISQNVTDLLQNYIASTLISNSEFIVLLKQSNIDSAKLAEVLTRISANVRELVRREQEESRNNVPTMGLIGEPDFVEDDAQEENGSSGQEGQTYSKAYLDRVFEEELKKSRERRMQTGTDSGNNWMIYG